MKWKTECTHDWWQWVDMWCDASRVLWWSGELQGSAQALEEPLFSDSSLTLSPDQHASVFLTHSGVYCTLCCSSVAPGFTMIARSLAAGVINLRLKLSGDLASNPHIAQKRVQFMHFYLSFVAYESCKLCTCLIIITLCVIFFLRKILGNYGKYKQRLINSVSWISTYGNSEVWSLKKCLTEEIISM